MAVKTYDPKKLSVSAFGLVIGGFADEMVEVEFNEDHYKLDVGATGEASRTRNANRSGKIKLVLAQTSESNDGLQAQAIADGLGALLIKDETGTTVISAATCWITKTPQSSFGKELKTREWMLETDELVMFVGGVAAS